MYKDVGYFVGLHFSSRTRINFAFIKDCFML